MEYKKEQKLKELAIASGLCEQCLRYRDKPCIFDDNNDEHLCPIVQTIYKYFYGGIE